MAVLLEGRGEDLLLMRLRQMLAEHRYKEVSGCTLRVGDLDDESRRALLGIFSKDFETLSYDPDLPLATAPLPSQGVQAPGAWWRLRQDEKVGLDGYEMEEVYAIRRRRAARNRRMRATKQTPPLAPWQSKLGQP